jgi:hypothetical protein
MNLIFKSTTVTQLGHSSRGFFGDVEDVFVESLAELVRKRLIIMRICLS